MPPSSIPRLVVFDCDGTLVDSAHAIVESMAAAWAAEKIGPPPSGGAVRGVVGLPLVEAIAGLHPAGETVLHERLADHYKAAFFEVRQRPDHEEPLYEGAREVIDRLDQAGVLLGIATGKSRRGLEATLGAHDLLDRFAVLKTADDGPGKPNPDILLDAMSELGVEAADTVMIGDTTFDVLMAVNAKVPAIGVEWGYHEAAALSDAGARLVLDRFAGLDAALNEIWPDG